MIDIALDHGVVSAVVQFSSPIQQSMQFSRAFFMAGINTDGHNRFFLEQAQSRLYSQKGGGSLRCYSVLSAGKPAEIKYDGIRLLMDRFCHTLMAKTEEFRRRLSEGATLDDLLPEAFATLA